MAMATRFFEAQKPNSARQVGGYGGAGGENFELFFGVIFLHRALDKTPSLYTL
jgi:hypothetical protein